VSCPSLRTFYKRLAERGGEVFWMGDWLIGGLLARMMLLLWLSYARDLRKYGTVQVWGPRLQERLWKTWDRVSLRKETLRNRKEDLRSKVLKIEKRSRVKRSKKATRLLCCCVSPLEHPAHLTPTLCMSVFCLSFLHLQSPPVRFSRNWT
jgi:hypothetical protein